MTGTLQNHKNKVWKFGDDVNTDVIIPGRYLNTSNPQELAKHCMEDAFKSPEDFKNFMQTKKEGDIIVAGKNFGCGSSREHAPIAIKASGITYVIAKSFARIYYRNSFNMGMYALECPETDKIEQDNELEIILDKGIIKNLTKNEEYKFNPIPKFMQELTNAGGLLAYIKTKYPKKFK